MASLQSTLSLTRRRVVPLNICMLALLVAAAVACGPNLQWTIYTRADDIGGNDIHDVFIGDDGLVWVATYGGKGASVFDGKTFRLFTEEDGLAHQNVNHIDVDSKGNAWFATDDLGISRFDGSEWTTYTTEDGLAHNRVLSSIVDPDGDLWVGTVEGLSRFDGSTWTTFTEEDGLAGNNIRSLAIDDQDNLWVGSGTENGGLTVYDGATWRTYHTDDGLVSDNVRFVTFDPQGILWIGTLGGLSSFDGTTFTNLKSRDGLASNFVLQIAFDSRGRIWLTAGRSGVTVIDGDEIKTYELKEGPFGHNISTVAVGPDDRKWVGTMVGGLRMLGEDQP